MHCVLKWQVTNGGFLPVHIETAAFSLLGRSAGHVVGPELEAGSEDADGVSTIDRTLSPGDAVVFILNVALNHDSCNVPESFTSYSEQPRVTVSALGIGGALNGDAAYTFESSDDTRCDAF